MEQAEIKRAAVYVRTEKYTDLMKAPIGGARASTFRRLFKEAYTGTMYPKDASDLGYGYHMLLP